MLPLRIQGTGDGPAASPQSWIIPANSFIISFTHSSCRMKYWFDSSNAEMEIFWENQVNTMVVDALAHCVARSSATMVLTMQDKQVFVYYWGINIATTPSQHWKLVENANIFICFLKWIWHEVHQGSWLIQKNHSIYCQRASTQDISLHSYVKVTYPNHE